MKTFIINVQSTTITIVDNIDRLENDIYYTGVNNTLLGKDGKPTKITAKFDGLVLLNDLGVIVVYSADVMSVQVATSESNTIIYNLVAFKIKDKDIVQVDLLSQLQKNGVAFYFQSSGYRDSDGKVYSLPMQCLMNKHLVTMYECDLSKLKDNEIVRVSGERMTHKEFVDKYSRNERIIKLYDNALSAKQSQK